MAGLLDPLRSELPDSEDAITIGGDKCPGKCTIKGLNSPRGWDVRKGTGLSGATIYPTGDELSKFSVLVEIWNGATYLAWLAFAKKYLDKSVRFSPGSSKPQALGIYHPQLCAPPFNISAVVVEDVLDNGQDEDGLWSFEIKFLQFRPPVEAAQKPVAAIAPAAVEQPTAKDNLDRETQQLYATFNSLAQRLQ